LGSATVLASVAAPEATYPCVREIKMGDSPYYDYVDYSNGVEQKCPTGYDSNQAYLDAQAAKKAAAQAAADKAAADKAAQDKNNQQQNQPQQQQQPQQAQQPQQQQNQNQPQQQQNQNAPEQKEASQPKDAVPDQASGDECGGSAIGASGETTDQAGIGDCQAKQGIKRAVSSLTRLNINNASRLKSSVQKYESAWKSCVADQSKAAQSCLENMSGNVISAQNDVNMLGFSSAAAETKARCGNNGKSMDRSIDGLEKYKTACGAAKAQCANSCQDALNELDQIKKMARSSQCMDPQDKSCTSALPQAKNGVPPAVYKEEQIGNLKAMAGKKDVCEQKYTQLMQSADRGIASLTSDSAVSHGCEDQTNGY
jgi:hypothetical protein